MPLEPFSFPLPETRFFLVDSTVYKFKLRYGSSCRGGEVIPDDATQEIEDAIRAVLANLDGLQPFTTNHFTVFPHKSEWERVSRLRFQQDGVTLKSYPFLLTLYLEAETVFHKRTSQSTNKTGAKRRSNPGPVNRADQRVSVAPYCPSCHPKRIKAEAPLGGAVARIQERMVGLQLDHGSHTGSRLWSSGPEAMGSDSEFPMGPPHLDPIRAYTGEGSSVAAHSEETQRHGEAACVIVTTPNKPHLETHTSQSTSVLLWLASKLFPFSLLFGHRK